MIGLTISVLLIIYYARRWYKRMYEKPDNFPPGPPSLPLYGAYFIVALKRINDLGTSFKELAKEYKTKIVGLYLGPYATIMINDAKLVKEVLTREEFDGRLDTILSRLRSFWKTLGIFFTDGYFWHVQRRFSLRYMRDYGFGRRDEKLETIVSRETKEMIDMVINGPKYPSEKMVVNGDLIYLQHYFAVPAVNALLYVFVRMTYPRSEYHTIWNLSKNALKFVRGTNDLGGALVLTPWLKDVMPKLSGYSDLVEGNKVLLDLFKKLIDDALASQDESYDRHFLDVYLRKMKEERRVSDRTTFSEEQLQLICTDYMLPTNVTLGSTLSLLVERILLQPEIQDKIHEEIDRVVGRDRVPTLDDRNKMPYVEACIREMLRYETLLPLGILHRSVAPTKLAGYDIPENTIVGINYLCLHQDKEIWGDPENFRPERFIENGQLVLSKDKSLPFGAGKRLCAGETFARNTIFQIFSTFMQAFKVSTADGKPLLKPFRRIQGIVTTLPEFWCRVTPRC